MSTSVCIIGAGSSGIAAAQVLHARRRSVRLLRDRRSVRLLRDRRVADLVTGVGALPSTDQMQAQIREYDERLRRRYVASKRHTLEVDFHKYLAEIERERRAARARAQGRPVRSGVRSRLAALTSRTGR